MSAMTARKSSKPRPARKPVVKPAAKRKERAPAKRKVAATALTLREQKTALRQKIRAALANLRSRAARSEKLCAAIVDSAAWRRASVVAIFAPMETEPDIELLWPHAHGKTLCYPTIRMGGLDFIAVSHADSVKIGQWGFREPVFDPAHVIPPDEFDLVLVPGAAFTADGHRLGRGGGFYDKLLATPGFRAFKIGICFDCQLVAAVPLEAHDQRVDRVATESGIQRW